MYPCLPAVDGSDTPRALPNPDGICRLLIVLLNPGGSPRCHVVPPSWIESPITSPTNRRVEELVYRFAVRHNWEQNDYARILCLFQNTGRAPNAVFDGNAEPIFPDVEQVAHAADEPVVFGWGGFEPALQHPNAQAFNMTRTAFINRFRNAVGAQYVHNPRGFAPIAPLGFNGALRLTPAHPAARAGGWAAAVLEQLQ